MAQTTVTAGFTMVRLNRRLVCRFAEAKGRLARNDRVDAVTIAQFSAMTLEDAPIGRHRDLDPPVEHLALRRQLIGWITDCSNQLEHLTDPAIRETVRTVEVGLRRRLARAEVRLRPGGGGTAVSFAGRRSGV